MKNAIFLSLMLFAAFSTVFAEDDVEPVLISAQLNESDFVSPETLEELAAFSLPEGIDLRIEMLKKEIIERIAYGEETITKIIELNSSINVSSLQAIVDELEILANETDLIDRTNVTSAVDSFVSIKKEALDLVSEFRELVYGMLTEEQRIQIREQITQRVQERIALNIQNVTRALNSYKNAYAQRIMNSLGYDNETLIEQFALGQINATRLKQALKVHYDEMNASEQLIALQAMNQSSYQLRQEIALRANNTLRNALNNSIQRLNQRIENLERLNLTNKDLIEQNIQNRIQNAENLRNEWSERIVSRVGTGSRK